ncbi:hypothetical protein ACRQ5Q_15045 [Bradyrhizobium sp. PMVTL-01]|uniref:hypothetical protein n=1 Tax=Bradyrhizobium sp. PMVTL-01 TaxID=3434999 RepID=UPI003F730946
MALKRIERPGLKGPGGPLKKIDRDGLERRRAMNKALDFVQGETQDVLAKIDEDATPEEQTAEVIGKLDAALNPEKQAQIKADLKRQKDAYVNQGANDYYCVVVFAEGAAVTEFLRKAGYGDTSATYVDGHVLAQGLKIDLPKPQFKLQKIRPPVRNLERLVTAFPKTKQS